MFFGIEATHSMDCVQLAAAIIPRGARACGFGLVVCRPAHYVIDGKRSCHCPPVRRQTVVRSLWLLVISQCAPRTSKAAASCRSPRCRATASMFFGIEAPLHGLRQLECFSASGRRTPWTACSLLPPSSRAERGGRRWTGCLSPRALRDRWKEIVPPPGRTADRRKKPLALVISQCAPRTFEGGSKLHALQGVMRQLRCPKNFELVNS